MQEIANIYHLNYLLTNEEFVKELCDACTKGEYEASH